MVLNVKTKKDYPFLHMQSEDVENMRPAIERAVKDKFEAIAANHPVGYWEHIGNALNRLKKT